MNSDSRNYVVIPLQDDGTTSVNKRGPGWNEGGVAYTLNTVDHISVAYGFQKSINGIDAEEEKQPPLQADTHTKAYTVDMGGGKSSVCTYEDQSPTLTCTHYGEPAVAYTLKIRGGVRHTKPGAERLRKQGKDR